MLGVGERGVQCCEVQGVVVTWEAEYRLGAKFARLGGRVQEWVGCSELLLWLYSHWQVPGMKTSICAGVSL